MTRAVSPKFTSQPIAAYEALRMAVLSGHTHGQCGLAIIVRRGLTAWACESALDEKRPTLARADQSICSAEPPPAPKELTSLLAGIIVALTTGDGHAPA